MTLKFSRYSKTKVNTDLKKAQKVLDEDHFGLEKVKEKEYENFVQKRTIKSKVQFMFRPLCVKTHLWENQFKAYYVKLLISTWRHQR